MFKSLLPWKHMKTNVLYVMAPEQTMENEATFEEQKLVPCGTCGRTFLALPLKKHAPICEKNASKKRKVFDSLKQRIEGTDLAQFHQKSYLKKPESTPKMAEKLKRPSRWEENHRKLVDAIRTAKESKDMSLSKKSQSVMPAATSPNERCPFCDRQFGPKAFDRHVEWCREHRTRIQKSPANVLLAKERLEARTKYKVPPLAKSKKITMKEKYSNPNTINRTESICSVKSTPPKRTPSVRKPKSVLDVGKKVETPSKIDKTNSTDEIKKCKVQNKTHASAPYNPFVSAERQLMELLECDDFKQLTKPLVHKQRPHTSVDESVKVHSKKLVKSAENVAKKRASVIDPPACFQDPDPDDFEFLENLINDQFNNDKFYLDQQVTDELDAFLSRRKYSDDVSSIDSNLINENDNLSIPEHFRRDNNYSPTSASDTDTTIQNDNVDLYNLQPDKQIESQTKGKVRKNSKAKTNSNSSEDAANIQIRTKNASSETVSNRKKIDAPFVKKKSQDSVNKIVEDTQEIIDLTVKAEDLFDVDDKMYAEYKIYEEMYLKEKEQGVNTKKQRTKNSIKSYGIEIVSDDHINRNKIPNDSAYGSLNRTTPVTRAAKPSSLERKRIDSMSSSGSDNFTNPPIFNNQRMSKFCHECGNKYPLQTAKFCVECGVKRLLL